MSRRIATFVTNLAILKIFLRNFKIILKNRVFQAKSVNYTFVMYFIYMIKNNFNKLYIGVSKDVNQRLLNHNTRRGSVYTKTGNFKVVFLEKYTKLSEARRREIQLKKWSRMKKEFLINKYKNNLPTKINK